MGNGPSLLDAAQEGDMRTVQSLIINGADVNRRRESDQWTVLYAAAWKGRTDVVKLLLQNGANVNAVNLNNWTALYIAAACGKTGAVKALLESHADPNVVGIDEWTALHRAAECGHPNIVSLLLANGAEANATGNDGRTPLYWAAENGHSNVVRILLAKGADVNAALNDGKTALWAAASLGHGEIVKSLLANGADADAVLRRASPEQHASIAEILAANGATVSNVAPSPPAPSPPAPLPPAPSPAPLAVHPSSTGADRPKWLILPHQVTAYEDVPLAVGSFGKVYRANWADCSVVVKEFLRVSDRDKRSLMKEVKLWADLRHNNIVPFYGANLVDEPYFVVSKYAVNKTLTSYLDKKQKQSGSPAVVWQKIAQVAAGLKYLHSQEIIHGDLKCNNIVVSHSGTAMLTDFGLSFLSGGENCTVMDMKHELGAMQWRAPEFATDTVTRPSFESDVYSLGMCIIAAVRGASVPWGEGFDQMSVRELLRNGNIAVLKPDAMTEDQWKLVEKMIAYDARDRPKLDDVLGALQTFAKNEENPFLRP